MAKSIDIIQRQEKVKKLMIRGLTYREIAQTLNTTEKTVFRDAKKIKERIILEIKREPVEKVIAQMSLEANAVVREAWKMYHNEKTSDKIRISCLRLVMDTLKRNSEILLNLGIIKRVPDILMTMPNIPELSRISPILQLTDVSEEDYWKTHLPTEALEEAKRLAKKDTSKHSDSQKLTAAIGEIYQKRKAEGFV